MIRLLLCLTFLASTVEGSQKLLQGSMDYTVKSTALVSIATGATEVFSGYKDGIKKGQKVKLLYTLYDANIMFELVGNGAVSGFWFTDKVTESLGSDGSGIDAPIRIENEHLQGLLMRQDKIIITSSGGSATLYRYFKNDWAVIFTMVQYGSLASLTSTLDCRNTHGRVDQIIEKVESRL